MRALHEETLALVKEERRLTGLIIENLQKISDTKLFLEMGYSSLFQYCTQALGYSEASAYRRLEAVKVMRAIPEIKNKLNDGALNLTTIALAQTFFKSQNTTLEEKREAIAKIEGCSKRQTEKVLANMFEVEAPAASREKIRHFRGEEAALQIVISQDVLAKLERIKSLRSHINSKMTYADVIADMCEIVLKKIDPMEKKQVHRSANEPKNPRHIPVKLKSEVWRRDHGRCTFLDTKSGRRCSSQHLLQLDHDTPLFPLLTG